MTALSVGVMGALFGLSVAGVSPTVRPPLVAVVGGVMAFQAVVLQPLSIRRPRIALRVAALVVGVKALQMVAGRASGVDAEFAVAVGVGMAAWVAGSGTAFDLDAIERGIDTADGLTPVQRLRMRANLLGSVAVIAAGWGVVGLGGLVDLRRPAAAGMSLAPILYFTAVVVGFGYAARRAEIRRWERDGARVDPTVSSRWSRGILVTVAGSVVVGLALPVVAPGMTAVPANAVAASGRVGDWVADRMLALGEALDTQADPGATGEGGPVTAPEFEPVEPALPWIGDVALWLLLAAIFASVIVRARNRRTITRGDPEPRLRMREVVAAMWREIVDLFSAIRRAMARWVRRLRRNGEEEVPEGAAAGISNPVGGAWNPSDPLRRRIAAAYRQARGVIGPVHGPVRRAETPRELAARVMHAPFTTVTRLYEEARYSDHVLSDRQALAAEAAAEDVASDRD